MKFTFDDNQDHQIQAIDAVMEALDGAVIRTRREAGADLFTASCERHHLDARALLSSVNAVQERNGISPDTEIRPFCTSDGLSSPIPNLAVEMETGTGKTYAYLRTIFRLNQKFGMTAFIVIVHSVAVREGVMHTLETSASHFREMFGSPVLRYWSYDGKKTESLRGFGESGVDILVMTMDSFNKGGNVIFQERDNFYGMRPIDCIRKASPVVVMDEPQNMESDQSKRSIASLDPCLILRFSATHRDPYNLIYRLSPAEAYRRGLVKRVQIASVGERGGIANPYVKLVAVRPVGKQGYTATLEVDALKPDGSIAKKKVTAKLGQDLFRLTGRVAYQGIELRKIGVDPAPFVGLNGGAILEAGDEVGPDREALFRAQLRTMIDIHFVRQRDLRERGIKVLSLVFLDRVANWVADDGVVRRLFREEFAKAAAQPEWRGEWGHLTADDVSEGYFASASSKGCEYFKDSNGRSEEDRAAYELIMRGKEDLLAFVRPGDRSDVARRRNVCFVVSHSALREGWDNPNVFQICTLNESVSTMRKRQEIGRGIRLAVDQGGNRVSDGGVNVLTVIPNQSYADYVGQYQAEIDDDFRLAAAARAGKASWSELTEDERARFLAERDIHSPIIPAAQADRTVVKVRDEHSLSPVFKELWDRVSRATRYRVSIDTDQIVRRVLADLSVITVRPPRIEVTMATLDVGNDGAFGAQETEARMVFSSNSSPATPDVIGMLSMALAEARPGIALTRKTLIEIVRDPKSLADILVNPAEWIAMASRIIRKAVGAQAVSGIKYEPSEDGGWELERLVDDEIMLMRSTVLETEPNCLTDIVPYDSSVEIDMTKDLGHRKDVPIWMKLPSRFRIQTPVGEYNPDYALVVRRSNGEAIYMVREAKDREAMDLEGTERDKTVCGREHFKALGVDYEVVTSAAQIC